jgi:hypothetical protein
MSINNHEHNYNYPTNIYERMLHLLRDTDDIVDTFGILSDVFIIKGSKIKFGIKEDGGSYREINVREAPIGAHVLLGEFLQYVLDREKEEEGRAEND